MACFRYIFRKKNPLTESKLLYIRFLLFYNFSFINYMIIILLLFFICYFLCGTVGVRYLFGFLLAAGISFIFVCCMWFVAKDEDS